MLNRNNQNFLSEQDHKLCHAANTVTSHPLEER